jgi:hypothetical protein
MNSRLIELETLIESEQRSFYKIGKALKQIRDERLYRDLLFESFEAYLKSRWDMSRSQAYRLIEAARIIDNLSASRSRGHPVAVGQVVRRIDDDDLVLR